MNNASILITGGTGSFGKAFVEYLLVHYTPKKIIIFSRDEQKQWAMANNLRKHNEVLRFFLGDVRDEERLVRAFQGVDYVVHAAANKIMPLAEYNPLECVKTNIDGAKNVLNAALKAGVKKVVALSTDKASSPSSLYGATKLVSDKLFIASNVYSGDQNTLFSVVRYGNVMGSRGSILPYFYSIKDEGMFPITHTEMTRFFVTLRQGVVSVLTAFEEMRGGEVFVKKIPSFRIADLPKVFSDAPKIEIVGVRKAEKLHEQMIGLEDSSVTFDFGDHYRLIPFFAETNAYSDEELNGRRVDERFIYSSDQNENWMDVNEVKDWVEENKTMLEQSI